MQRGKEKRSELFSEKKRLCTRKWLFILLYQYNQTWGLEAETVGFGISFPFLDSCFWYSCFWGKGCFGTDDCETTLCTPRIESFTPCVEEALFSTLATGIFEGNPFGPTIGRPGPLALLLPSCFLESIDGKACLLVEFNLLGAALGCICPFFNTGFLSSRPLETCLIALLENDCLLFIGTWADLASSNQQ